MAIMSRRSKMTTTRPSKMGKGLAGAALAVGTAIFAWRRWGHTGEQRTPREGAAARPNMGL